MFVRTGTAVPMTGAGVQAVWKESALPTRFRFAPDGLCPPAHPNDPSQNPEFINLL